MALGFVPQPGTILLCDYDRGRVRPLQSEMTKCRPVVVLSERPRWSQRPFVVVPFSTQAPAQPEPIHYRIPAGRYPFFAPDADSWAKCEFVSAVSVERLDRLWRNNMHVAPRLHDADLQGILLGVIRAIGGRSLLRGR
jgi:uncharacterized protein YifN (PemK superfamily)